MSLILIYIAIVFTVVALVMMVLPLFGSRVNRARVEYFEEELRTIEGLATKRATLLQQLRDLEFDRETDKVSTEDYERFKRRYELEAVAVMRQLDALRGGQNWDAIVDAEIARHQGTPLPEAFSPEPDEKTAVAVASEKERDEADESEQVALEESEPEPDHLETRKSESSGDDDEAELHCSACGTEIAPDDRFCRQCGAHTPGSQQDPQEASA